LSKKSTFLNATSQSYALALYELSKENSDLDKVEENIKSINKLLRESSDFKEMILNPTISKEEKQNVMSIIAKQNNFPSILTNFLTYISSKNRLFFLNKIIESFLALVAKNKGEINAKLVSSKKLSEEEKEKIKSELSKNFQSPLNIDYKFDPDLIAGLVIQVGSVMIDTSIKTKLKKLEQNMIEA